MVRILIISATVLLLSLCACNQQAEPVDYGLPKLPDKDYKLKLEKANRGLIHQDSLRVVAFLKEKNWDIRAQGRGIWFQKTKQTQGRLVHKGDYVTLSYQLHLLDGRLCYSSDSDGPKRFRVGQGGVESGLEDAILLLREGESARLILPPYLAHGLLGDGKKIPPRAILLYELELQNIKPKTE